MSERRTRTIDEETGTGLSVMVQSRNQGFDWRIAVVQARIHQGRVELQDPIPEAWEGQFVKLVPLSPDDPLADLDHHLARLHALGPMEYLPGEREMIENELQALDQQSRQAAAKIGKH